MKRCSKCGEEKPCAEFGKLLANPDGLRRSCKACRNSGARAEYAANPTAQLERTHKWYAANIERVREANRERARVRRAAQPRRARVRRGRSPELAQMRARRYNASEKGRTNNRSRHLKWYAANPGARGAHESARRARKLANTTALTPAERAAVRAIYATAALSSAFRASAGLSPVHVDHVTPLALGGAHTADNLQLLPTELNLAKQALPHDEALARVPGYREWTEGPPLYWETPCTTVIPTT